MRNPVKTAKKNCKTNNNIITNKHYWLWKLNCIIYLVMEVRYVISTLISQLDREPLLYCSYSTGINSKMKTLVLGEGMTLGFVYVFMTCTLGACLMQTPTVHNWISSWTQEAQNPLRSLNEATLVCRPFGLILLVFTYWCSPPPNLMWSNPLHLTGADRFMLTAMKGFKIGHVNCRSFNEETRLVVKPTLEALDVCCLTDDTHTDANIFWEGRKYHRFDRDSRLVAY